MHMNNDSQEPKSKRPYRKTGNYSKKTKPEVNRKSHVQMAYDAEKKSHIVKAMPSFAKQVKQTENVDFMRDFDRHVKTNIIGVSVEEINDGLIGSYTELVGETGVPGENQKRYFPDLGTLVSKMITDMFPHMKYGFNQEKLGIYDILIVSNQDISFEMEKNKMMRQLLDHILERDRNADYNPYKNTVKEIGEAINDEVKLLIDDSEVYSIEKLKEFNFRQLKKEAGLTNLNAAKIANMGLAAYQQAEDKIAKSDYGFRGEEQRLRFTKLAKYYETVLQLKNTAAKKKDAVLERLQLLQDQLKGEIKIKGTGGYVHVEYLTKISNKIEEILLIN